MPQYLLDSKETRFYGILLVDRRSQLDAGTFVYIDHNESRIKRFFPRLMDLSLGSYTFSAHNPLIHIPGSKYIIGRCMEY